MTSLLILLALLISNPLAVLLAFTGMIYDYRNCKKYALCLSIAMGVFAYNYIPIGQPDLTRYFELINAAQNMSLGEYYAFIGDSLYVTNTVFWFMGVMQCPHMVPALSVFVVYFSAFYITTDYAMLIGKGRHAWKVLLLQIACLNFSSIANNIRNISCFAIVLLAVYIEMVKNKRSIITLLMYVIACFIHESGIILVIAYFAQLIFRKRTIVVTILAMIIPISINILISYRAEIARFGAIGSIVSNLVLISYRAMNSTSRWALRVTTSSRYLADRYLSILICACIYFVIYKSSKKTRGRAFFLYVSIICALTVSCNVFRTPAYWRLFSACICSGGPVILVVFTDRILKKFKKSICSGIAVALAILSLSVHLYSSTGEINYIDLLAQTMLSPLSVIIVSFVSKVFLGAIV